MSATTGIPRNNRLASAVRAAPRTPPRRLTKELAETLYSVLLDAFPSASDLEQLVRFRLGVSLNEISSEKVGLAERTFALIQWAETNARVVDLVQGAIAQRPNNVDLKEIATNLESFSYSLFASEDVLVQLIYRRAEAIEHGEDHRSIDLFILEEKRRRRNGPQPKIGDSFGLNGRYLLAEVLGHGGFATVWKAYDFETGTFVAIKILHGQWMHDESRIERFIRGVKVMRQLGNHPYVVQALSECELWQDHYYFVMRLETGGDLHDAVMQGRVNTGKAAEIISKVADALKHAHEQKIVHRDVKPQNILLSEDLEPRLTDFDLAYVAGSTGGTRTGALGTVLYAAPEMLSNAKDADERADIYSLGMTLLFALYGALKLQNLPGDLAANRGPILKDLLAKLESVHPLTEPLAKATMLRREDRFSSMLEFQVGLMSSIVRLESEQRTKLPILFKAFCVKFGKLIQKPKAPPINKALVPHKESTLLTMPRASEIQSGSRIFSKIALAAVICALFLGFTFVPIAPEVRTRTITFSSPPRYHSRNSSSPRRATTPTGPIKVEVVHIRDASANDAPNSGGARTVGDENVTRTDASLIAQGSGHRSPTNHRNTLHSPSSTIATEFPEAPSTTAAVPMWGQPPRQQTPRPIIIFGVPPGGSTF